METKHTPGPWVVDSEYPNQVIVEGTPEGHRLTGLVADCSRGYWKDEVSEANARLIAAAPTMLSRLDAARTVFQDIRSRHPRKSFHDNRIAADCEVAIEFITEALTLAQGE